MSLSLGIIIGLLIIFVIISIFLFVIILFNNYIKLKNLVDKSFSNIDVVLKQRANEIPNLVNVVKAYANHEKQVLENISLARSNLLNSTDTGNVKEIAKNEDILSHSLKSLFAVSENYPDLKANKNFLELQKRISDIEDIIADRREFYNDSVNNYNIWIESFPNNIIVKIFNAKKRDLFETEQRSSVEVRI